MEFNNDSIERLRELIGSGPRKIIVVSHTNPDGDAIGSSLAWGKWLESKGHDVWCVVPNRYPYFLSWMQGIDRLKIFKDDKNGEIARRIAEAEIIFCLDFNVISRLEGLGETIERNTTAASVLIDHHLDPPSGFTIALSHTESSSTSFLIYKLIERLEGTEAITREMAEGLYVGIMTDTGNFSFSFLTSELFEAVAEIVRKGVDIARVNSLVYNSFSVSRVRLLGYTLNRMETLRVGETGVAYMSLTEAEMRRFKFQQGDSEGFVNYPLMAADITFSAIFIETRNFIRISLRSRGDIDVSLFGKLYFEGGGHKNAAGGKSFKTMAETIAYFRQSVEEFLGQGGDSISKLE